LAVGQFIQIFGAKTDRAEGNDIFAEKFSSRCEILVANGARKKSKPFSKKLGDTCIITVLQ